ncbi:MAG: TIGR03032 family protein [Brumimicrobium sp.]
MPRTYSINFEDNFAKILFDKKVSLVFSTYQAGRLMVLGSLDGNHLHQIPVGFKKPMGIAISDNKLAVATLDNLYFFSNRENVVDTIRLNEKNFDTVFLQRAKYATSTLDVHDIEFGKGILWGVNTVFSCICVFDINHNFIPKWKPPFITSLVPEDRCHLNGMVLENNLPVYASMLSLTNTKEGWRENITETGAILTVPEGEVMADGLSLPHSLLLDGPYLYFLESGKGTLNRIHRETKEMEVIHDFERFVRGMKKLDNLIFIGYSAVRKSSKTFSSVRFENPTDNAGVLIYDIDLGKVISQLEYEQDVEEIYDLNYFDGFLKPAIVNDKQEEFNNVITYPKNVFWKKPVEK